MLSGVPNFAFAIGYTNASWTLKVDLVCEHFCRLLRHMDDHGYRHCVPERRRPARSRRGRCSTSPRATCSARSTRSRAQGSEAPWQLHMSYAADSAALRGGPVEDPALRLGHAVAAAERAA